MLLGFWVVGFFGGGGGGGKGCGESGERGGCNRGCFPKNTQTSRRGGGEGRGGGGLKQHQAPAENLSQVHNRKDGTVEETVEFRARYIDLQI